MREFLQSSYLSRLQLRKGDRRSVAFSSKTEKLDLGEEEGERRSGTARRLGGSACPFIGRRSEGATAMRRKVSG